MSFPRGLILVMMLAASSTGWAGAPFTPEEARAQLTAWHADPASKSGAVEPEYCDTPDPGADDSFPVYFEFSGRCVSGRVVFSSLLRLKLLPGLGIFRESEWSSVCESLVITAAGEPAGKPLIPECHAWLKALNLPPGRWLIRSPEPRPAWLPARFQRFASALTWRTRTDGKPGYEVGDIEDHSSYAPADREACLEFRDGTDHEPLSGHSVELLQDWQRRGRLVTDKRGRACFKGLRPGPFVLHAPLVGAYRTLAVRAEFPTGRVSLVGVTRERLRPFHCRIEDPHGWLKRFPDSRFEMLDGGAIRQGHGAWRDEDASHQHNETWFSDPPDPQPVLFVRPREMRASFQLYPDLLDSSDKWECGGDGRSISLRARHDEVGIRINPNESEVITPILLQNWRDFISGCRLRLPAPPELEMTLAITCPEGKHPLPVLGLRIESQRTPGGAIHWFWDGPRPSDDAQLERTPWTDEPRRDRFHVWVAKDARAQLLLEAHSCALGDAPKVLPTRSGIIPVEGCCLSREEWPVTFTIPESPVPTDLEAAAPALPVRATEPEPEPDLPEQAYTCRWNPNLTSRLRQELAAAETAGTALTCEERRAYDRILSDGRSDYED